MTLVLYIEFKLDRPAEEALAQIDERNYAEKYDFVGKTVRKLGISFSFEPCTIVDVKVGWGVPTFFVRGASRALPRGTASRPSPRTIKCGCWIDELILFVASKSNDIGRLCVSGEAAL